MPQIGRLWTDLELESSQFSVGLRKAVAESTAASAKIQKELSGIRSSLMAGVGAIAGLGLVSAAREALDYASSLEEVANQLGVTTRDLQEYRYAATQAGVSQEAMDKSLAKLTVTMGQARDGGKKQAAAFRELNNIIGRDILASSQSAGDAIPFIAEALGKIEDPTRRARLEVALFGKAGQQLDPLLKGGSAAVNELRDAAHSLGIVLSDQAIQDADRTADKLSELNTVLSANIASAVANNTREIYGFVDALSSLISMAPQALRAIANFRDELVVRQGAVRRDIGFISQNSDMQRSGQSDVRDGQARIRARNASSRRDSAVARLERLGYIVPRNPDGSINEAGIRKAPPRVTASGGNAGTPSASSSPGRNAGRRGGSGGESAAEKAERARLWYEDQILRSKIEELGIQDQIVESASSRYALAIGRIDADRKSFAQDVKEREGLSAAQQAELIAANEVVLAKQLELADQDKFRAQARESYDLFAAGNDAEQERVRAQLDMARTAGERRALELRLLELQKQAERAQLELVIATESTASAAAKNAQLRLDALDDVYEARQDAAKRGTMGPLARYRDSLPRTAEEIGEAYEEIAVRGIERMNDALGDSIKQTIGLKGAVGDLITEILLLEAKKMLFGNAGGGFLSSVGRALGLLKGGGFDAAAASEGAGSAAEAFAQSLPRFATGGSLLVGGKTGIDRNVLSINGTPAALVSAGERVNVTPDKLRAANDVTVRVVKGDYFDAIVEGKAVNVMGSAAPALVGASAGVTQSKAQYRAGRRLA